MFGNNNNGIGAYMPVQPAYGYGGGYGNGGLFGGGSDIWALLFILALFSGGWGGFGGFGWGGMGMMGMMGGMDMGMLYPWLSQSREINGGFRDQMLSSKLDNLSTAVGNGIAVPHPRDPIPTLQMPGCIVYGYSKKGVDFNAPDGKPVHFFFLLCSQNIELHLHMMRCLASILRVPQFIEACQKAAKPADIVKAVIEQETANFLHRDPEEDFEQ